jgi:MYXO-CTERM domain-containing protein
MVDPNGAHDAGAGGSGAVFVGNSDGGATNGGGTSMSATGATTGTSHADAGKGTNADAPGAPLGCGCRLSDESGARSRTAALVGLGVLGALGGARRRRRWRDVT